MQTRLILSSFTSVYRAVGGVGHRVLPSRLFYHMAIFCRLFRPCVLLREQALSESSRLASEFHAGQLVAGGEGSVTPVPWLAGGPDAPPGNAESGPGAGPTVPLSPKEELAASKAAAETVAASADAVAEKAKAEAAAKEAAFKGEAAALRAGLSVKKPYSARDGTSVESSSRRRSAAEGSGSLSPSSRRGSSGSGGGGGGRSSDSEAANEEEPDTMDWNR